MQNTFATQTRPDPSQKQQSFHLKGGKFETRAIPSSYFPDRIHLSRQLQMTHDDGA